MSTNPLIKKYGRSKQWVNWKFKVVEGRKTKIPIQANGRNASSTDPSHWQTYKQAIKNDPNVGIVFKPDRLLLGVDMDHVLEGLDIVHEERQKIFEFIAESNTYCEVSPSGTGLHLYFELTEPLNIVSNKKHPYELYTHGRYFTTTFNVYGSELDVRTVTPKEIEDLLAILDYPWKKKKEEPLPPVASGEERSDDVVLKKMFKSKNGSSIERLFNGDISDHSNDKSSADMALLSHLAFWTGKNASQMERIWMSSPLGSREKTQEREDYRVRSIGNAIDNCKEVYETKADKVVRENPGIDFLYILNKEKERQIIRNTENICRVLRGHPAFMEKFRYDVFNNAYQICIDGVWRGLEDTDAINTQTEISILFPDFFGTVGKEMVYDAIIKVSKECMVDSASDYIRSIVWDQVPRVDHWLSKTYGVPDDAYHKAVASNWLKGLVKRIIKPGCKFDYVLVLEGDQGAKKSTSLAVLGGDWHVETTMSTESKDFFMQFQGKAIIEFSEGETLSRTEVKRMKAIITTQVDKYRAPYERASIDYPRRCVFAMTTNQEEYLKDETGNRRWLPVKLVFQEANIEWLKKNRDQLLAEAFHRAIVLEEKVYEFPEAETRKQQDSRRVRDANADMIVDWYWHSLTPKQRNEGITIHQVHRDCLNSGYVAKSMDKLIEMRISDVLRNTLRLQKKRKMVGGNQAVYWEPLVMEEEVIRIEDVF